MAGLTVRCASLGRIPRRSQNRKFSEAAPKLLPSCFSVIFAMCLSMLGVTVSWCHGEHLEGISCRFVMATHECAWWTDIYDSYEETAGLCLIPSPAQARWEEEKLVLRLIWVFLGYYVGIFWYGIQDEGWIVGCPRPELVDGSEDGEWILPQAAGSFQRQRCIWALLPTRPHAEMPKVRSV